MKSDLAPIVCPPGKDPQDLKLFCPSPLVKARLCADRKAIFVSAKAMRPRSTVTAADGKHERLACKALTARSEAGRDRGLAELTKPGA